MEHTKYFFLGVIVIVMTTETPSSYITGLGRYYTGSVEFWVTIWYIFRWISVIINDNCYVTLIKV